MFGIRRKDTSAKGTRLLAFMVLGLLVSFGCQEAREPVDSHVGKMDDVSYSGGRGKKYGPNALGDVIGVEDFAGYFVWVDYAAPWCSPCSRQAPIIRKLERSLGEEVVFLTVMTSGAEPMQSSTQLTAKRWAKRFKLEPSWVVAEGNSYRTIPQHALFSPLGQTLYRETGLHSEVQIKSTLARLIRKWEAWNARSDS